MCAVLQVASDTIFDGGLAQPPDAVELAASTILSRRRNNAKNEVDLPSKVVLLMFSSCCLAIGPSVIRIVVSVWP